VANANLFSVSERIIEFSHLHPINHPFSFHSQEHRHTDKSYDRQNEMFLHAQQNRGAETYV
jgi:hypothetical protein